MRSPLYIVAWAILVLLVGCTREKRDFHTSGTPADGQGISMSSLRPGGGMRLSIANPSEDRAYDLSQGKRLYNAYNCVGCHAHGGGGMGPPLMDGDWIYGSAPQNVYATIVEGRPNGMPSFRGKIPEGQLWQIVAYVRSMSGQLPQDVAPSRSDHMNVKKPENRMERETEKAKPEKQ
jgi:cytochrome c oxidase cbb3-type subunit III